MSARIIPNQPDSDYHAGDGYSSSQLRVASREAGLARLKYAPHEDKPAYVTGRAAHTAILGRNYEDNNLPAQLGKPLLALPERVGKLLSGKKAQDFIEENPDWQVVTQADYDLVMRMRDALDQPFNREARELLDQPGKPEQSVYWEDEETGLLCKCRPDYLPDADATAGEQVFVDYKTTSDASPRKFRYSVLDYGYDQAAAWYAEGLRTAGYHENPRMVFIVQEKTPPFLCAVYDLNPASVDQAHQLNHETLRLIGEAEFSGEWAGYARQTLTI